MTATDPPRPEVLALLQQIKEEPDDDALRLILADWLDDHGDPRGELIRLGCDHAEQMRRPESYNRDPYYRLRELRRRSADAWVRPLLVLGGVPENISFVRGLTRIALDAARLLNPGSESLLGTETLAWVEEASYWIDGANLLRAVAGSPLFPHFAALRLNSLRDQFTADVEDVIVELMGSPRLAHLTGLALGLPIGDRTLQALAASPYLGRLRRLELRETRATAAGVQALCASSHLGRLTELELSNEVTTDDASRLGDLGARALAASPLLGRLTRLSLSCADIGNAGVAALGAAAPTRLTRLALDRNHFGDAGAQKLAASSLLAGLTHLDLAVNELGDAGALALAASARLTRLTHLNLFRNHIGPAGMRALASSASLAGLTHLNLEENEVGGAGPQALADSSHLTGLVEVDLGYNHFGDAGAKALAGGSPSLFGRLWSGLRRRLRPERPAAPFPGPIQILRLAGNEMTAEGVRAFAGSPRLASVSYLDLSSNPIGDAGLIALMNSPFLDRLTSLNLNSCAIMDAGLQALLDSPRLPRLAELRLQGNSFDFVSAALALAASPHRASLTRLSLTMRWTQDSERLASDLERLAASPHMARFSEFCLGFESPAHRWIDARTARAVAALFRPSRSPLTVCLCPDVSEGEQALHKALVGVPGVELYYSYGGRTWSGIFLEG
jgi:uncharacterized protein (TIGR02996 family)